MFYGLTNEDDCSLAYHVVWNNTLHLFKDKVAGKNWFYTYIRRNPKPSVGKLMDTSFARTRGLNKNEIDKFS